MLQPPRGTVNDMVRAWIDGDDTFTWEIDRAPEDREPGRGVSRQVLDSLGEQLKAFLMARMIARVNAGRPADRISVTINVNDLQDN